MLNSKEEEGERRKRGKYILDALIVQLIDYVEVPAHAHILNVSACVCVLCNIYEANSTWNMILQATTKRAECDDDVGDNQTRKRGSKERQN